MTTATLAAPAIASAAVYCVGNSGGDCTVPESGNATGLQTALTAAAGGSGGDKIEIAGGLTLATTSPAGFQYSSFNPITVVGGVGGGTTTIQTTAPGAIPGVQTTYFGLNMPSAASSNISNLTVTMPAPFDVNNTRQQFKGIDAEGTNVSIDHVTVTAPVGISYNGIGVMMDSGTLSDSTVTMPMVASGLASIGVWQVHTTTTDLNLVRDAITGGYGFQYDDQGPAFGRVSSSQITARFVGVLAQASKVSVGDSFINLGANASAHGLEVGYQNIFAHTSLLTADGVSIFGSGDNQVGVHVFGTDANTMPNPGDPDVATAGIANSIIRLTGSNPTPIWRAADHNGIVNVATSYSDYDSSKDLESPNNTNGATGAITTSNDVFLNPLFVNEGGGDLHLQAGSPLIDAGDPAAPAAGRTDIDGDPRAVMAVASCSPRRDIGADEFVPASPVAPLNCTPTSTGTTTPPPVPTATKKKCKRKHRRTAAKKRCKKKR